MNIFLGVYACEPHKGSEPEVGWQMVNEIAKAMPNDTIYALTKLNNKDVIEAEGYPDNVKFFYYAPPKWLTFWKKGGRGVRTYYYIWMLTAALFMKKQNVNFDIIHHVTFVNDWLPSFFYLLKTNKNKFIWGPIGSHEGIQAKFLDCKKKKLIEKIRMFLQYFYRNIDPSFHICKAKADCIIGITKSVKNKLNIKTNKLFIAEPAIAMSQSTVKEIKEAEKSNSLDFTILSVGRLLYIKNFKLAILSFSYFLKNNPSIQNAKLKIIGEGTDKKSLITFTKELNIANKVEFVGQIPRKEVQENFYNANLFLFPTLESAGFVTLEAMSNYLPVVAMKYGGPLEFIKHNIDEQLVTYEQNYEDIAKDIAKKIEKFYFDKEFSKSVGKQNHQDILKNFTWEAKAQKMKTLYWELLNEKN
jgi:glycosyltransferase involved in cell wall biosynthesis